jgi:hypothetical protein
VKRVPITLSRAENGAKLRRMIGAVVYVRVSDPRQAENLSLATQLKACEDYGERQDFVALERFSDQRGDLDPLISERIFYKAQTCAA